MRAVISLLLAAATATVALAAAFAMIVHEMRSYLVLKTVEANQEKLAHQLQNTTQSEARDEEPAKASAGR